MEDGPYIVTGNVPLSEKIIVPKGKGYVYEEGRTLPQSESYALCRCGKSAIMPFCDGAHTHVDFRGKETASQKLYRDRAVKIEGADLDLMDDDRCAFARFCHRENGNAWELAEKSDISDNKAEAIQAACDCPTGRLIALEKDGTVHEHAYEPAIDILQDPEKAVSSGIFVKGGIPIESADGTMYETRNRAVLCRCGQSHNKPFCDATHVVVDFIDGQKE